jgi:hypothetical protein
VLLGNGNGIFGAKTDFGTGNIPWSVAIGDLNGDGKPDLATAKGGGTESVSVLLNIGPGAVDVGPSPGPRVAVLLAPTPNPARSATTIAFELPASESVTLEIFDTTGRLTRVLSTETTFAAGRHAVKWDGTSRTGQRVASGIYFVRFRAGQQRGMQRVVMLR